MISRNHSTAEHPGSDKVIRRNTALVVGAEVVRTVGVRPTAIDGLVREGMLWAEGTVVPLGRLGTLAMERPWQHAVWSGLPGWRASGRLVARGWRARRFGGVDLEISPWSATAMQIRLARQSPFPSYWGARRVRRYWELAHAAANQLTVLVSTEVGGFEHGTARRPENTGVQLGQGAVRRSGAQRPEGTDIPPAGSPIAGAQSAVSRS